MTNWYSFKIFNCSIKIFIQNKKNLNFNSNDRLPVFGRSLSKIMSLVLININPFGNSELMKSLFFRFEKQLQIKFFNSDAIDNINIKIYN